MPKIRAILEVTLTYDDQAHAKQDVGVTIPLPCETRDLIVKLQNGVPIPMTEDQADGR